MAGKHLKELAFWSKFVGWCFLITGIISALIGLFALIIGAIPGVITSVMGWKLIKASSHAEKLSHSENDEVTFEAFLQNYLTFFKIQGILFMISIVISILSFISIGMNFFFLWN